MRNAEKKTGKIASRRADAIRRFTDKVDKTGVAHAEDIIGLRALGVSETRIRALAEKHGSL